MLECVCCGSCAVVVGVPKPNFMLTIDPMKLLHENKTIRGICQGDSMATKAGSTRTIHSVGFTAANLKR